MMDDSNGGLTPGFSPVCPSELGRIGRWENGNGGGGVGPRIGVVDREDLLWAERAIGTLLKRLGGSCAGGRSYSNGGSVMFSVPEYLKEDLLRGGPVLMDVLREAVSR